jgi:hypothetical protein
MLKARQLGAPLAGQMCGISGQEAVSGETGTLHATRFDLSMLSD